METDFNQYFRKSLLKLNPYQSAREEFVNGERKMILLDANENPFTTSVNRYPDSHANGAKNRNFAMEKGRFRAKFI